MGAKLWGNWRAALMWGLATLAVSLLMGSVFPQVLAHPFPGSTFASPVLAFEFSTTPEHLFNVFGAPDEPLYAERIKGMVAGNWLDYLFMVIYGSFILTFFGASAVATRNHRWWLAGWLGPLAALFDAVENALLLLINADMADAAGKLALLPVFVWTKFALLALSCALAGWALVKQGGWPLALLCIPALPVIVPAMFDRWLYGELVTATIAIAWLGMLGWCVWRVLRRNRVPVPSLN